ncbi:MAG: hypothetical protein WAU45_00015 [Blastocatellia bacterium]
MRFAKENLLLWRVGTPGPSVVHARCHISQFAALKAKRNQCMIESLPDKHTPLILVASTDGSSFPSPSTIYRFMHTRENRKPMLQGQEHQPKRVSYDILRPPNHYPVPTSVAGNNKIRGIAHRDATILIVNEEHALVIANVFPLSAAIREVPGFTSVNSPKDYLIAYNPTDLVIPEEHILNAPAHSKLEISVGQVQLLPVPRDTTITSS